MSTQKVSVKFETSRSNMTRISRTSYQDLVSVFMLFKIIIDPVAPYRFIGFSRHCRL